MKLTDPETRKKKRSSDSASKLKRGYAEKAREKAVFSGLAQEKPNGTKRQSEFAKFRNKRGGDKLQQIEGGGLRGSFHEI